MSTPESDDADIRGEFRAFVLENHPDRGGDPERFRAGVDAYRRRMSAPLTSGPITSADVVFHRRPRGMSAVVARVRRLVPFQIRKP